MGKTNRQRARRRISLNSPTKKISLARITKGKQKTQNRNLKKQIEIQIKNRVHDNRPQKTPIKNVNLVNESIKKITSGRKIKYTTDDNDSFNIKITYDTSPNTVPYQDKISNINRKSANRGRASANRTRNKPLNSIRKTINYTNDDNTDDVILINDCDDSDVIFVGSNNNTTVPTNTTPDDSVILIEDDSVVEVQPQPTPTSRGVGNIPKHVVPSPIFGNIPKHAVPSPISNEIAQTQGRINGNASSTPVRSMYDFSVPYLFNMEMCRIQKDMTSSDVSNKFGYNFLNAGTIRTQGLRPIFIDGSNVAMGHSNGKFFSVKGLKICIDYFKMRGHEVTAIIPNFRQKNSQNSDSTLLQQLISQGHIILTPSRNVNGKNIVPYDDRYIVLLAHVHKGIIVSSDNFRDLLAENQAVLETIENRILNPTWLRDMIIFPSDPLGRHGPKLDEFLRFP